jgi:thiol-disulfide isomerase/thioredoxin
MALTESNMLELGTEAPDFSLIDTVDNDQKSLKELKGEKGTVVMFICNHCPYVIHINSQLVSIANTYAEKGISFVAISSNDVENYPDDSPEKMKLIAKVLKYPFPYLYDKTQSVAKAYKAACTPDIYLFDDKERLFYRGRLDGSRPGNDIPLTGSDLRFALDALLLGISDVQPQIPSAGCNIKWKN